MTPAAADGAIHSSLDEPTRALVRLSAALAGGTEDVVRAALHDAAASTPHQWIEELLLQTYLFAGFPRALNGMREWRRVAGPPARHASSPAATAAQQPPTNATRNPEPSGPSTGTSTGASTGPSRAERRRAGEATCASVYGSMYEKLRVNIRALHPLLDEWMIEEGYGKVLSRPDLDLQRRELCIFAACAATGQDRQLQSHLHGARNVGVAAGTISEVLASLVGVVPEELRGRAQRIWNRIRSDVH